MNLLLVDPHELDGEGRILLRDARARHLVEVLHVTAGKTVRAGILDGPVGAAEVVRVECPGAGKGSDARAPAVELVFVERGEVPERARDVLLLAVPRPRVLARCLAAAAALGYGRIVLFRSWCVDKAHLAARHVGEDAVRAALFAGLEQGARTHLPEVRRFDAFRPFVEDALEACLTPPRGGGDATRLARYLAHPPRAEPVGVTTPLHRLAPPAGTPPPFALLLGPERGLIPYEVARLTERGFRPVDCGPAPLTVETALGVLTGQLRMLHPET